MKISEFLSKEHTIAKPGFNRWLVPPAALAIHLSIGMAYGFSVFWLPLSKAIGVNQAAACPENITFFQHLVNSTCDWPISLLGWTFTLFFVFLGSSAAIWGGWLEKAGPRKVGLVAACCWSGGLVIAALAVYLHQLWLLWLGAGMIGGIGLGLGYISPVSTLMRWFPDKRGMATGMAIMGFGGGAMIGAPLADTLMKHFATSASVGVWQTFLVLAGIYFLFMIFGSLSYRVPPADWKPAGWEPKPEDTHTGMITAKHMSVRNAMKTRQFWLLWAVLCLNVTAGIGILGMASPLLQEVFGGRLINLNIPFSELNPAQKTQIASVAAGFAGLLSLFNIGGRFVWASFSDKIGRKTTFFIFFVLGAILYALVPTLGKIGSLPLFVIAFCITVSMYGGGFATIPAYLADMFGTQMVGAIHGRLLTAWSTAGILGPVLVNYIREFQLKKGVPSTHAYDQTMYILAGLLVIGFICNLLVTPVTEDKFMSDEELAEARRSMMTKEETRTVTSKDGQKDRPTSPVLIGFAWLAVVIPLFYGFWDTIQKASKLFR